MNEDGLNQSLTTVDEETAVVQPLSEFCAGAADYRNILSYHSLSDSQTNRL